MKWQQALSRSWPTRVHGVPLGLLAVEMSTSSPSLARGFLWYVLL